MTNRKMRPIEKTKKQGRERARRVWTFAGEEVRNLLSLLLHEFINKNKGFKSHSNCLRQLHGLNNTK